MPLAFFTPNAHSEFQITTLGQAKTPHLCGASAWLEIWFVNQTFDREVECDIQEIRDLIDDDTSSSNSEEDM